MPRIIHDFVLRTLTGLKLWPAVFRYAGQSLGHPVLAVFMFHRVLTEPPPESHLQGYERGVPFNTYVRQLDHIQRFYKIVDLSEFIGIIDGRVPADNRQPVALLTFDDADTTQEQALEELIRRDLPGVLFVPTAFIESRRRFYHLRLTNLVNNLNTQLWRQILSGDIPVGLRGVIQEEATRDRIDRRQLRRKLVEPFMNMAPVDRDILLDSWEDLIGRKYTLGIGCMTWSRIAEFADHGIAIGSHTVHHNRLALLSEEEQHRELIESKKILESRLNTAIQTVCYPEGSYTSRTLELAREVGYKFGFSVRHELVRLPLKDDDRMKIPRVGVTDGTDRDMIWSLGRPALKALKERDRG